MEFLALMFQYIYVQEKELQEREVRLIGKIKKTIRLHARRSMIERWNDRLSESNTGGLEDRRSHPALSRNLAR